MHGNLRLSALIFPDHFTVLAYHVFHFSVLFKFWCIHLPHLASHISYRTLLLNRFTAQLQPLIRELMSRSITVKSWEICRGSKIMTTTLLFSQRSSYPDSHKYFYDFQEKYSIPFTIQCHVSHVAYHYPDGAKSSTTVLHL